MALMSTLSIYLLLFFFVNYVTNLLCMCCCYYEADVSSGIRGKDVMDKASVYSAARTHSSGVRRHTVSSDMNTTAVSIICIYYIVAYYLL